MKKPRKAIKFIALLICFCFIFEQAGFTQTVGELDLSAHFLKFSGSLTQDKFRPLHLRYLSYDAVANNFKLLLDKGDLNNPQKEDLKSKTKQLLNYFFIGISLPNNTFWVNLRPDSPSQIIDPLLEETEIGKIFLEADLQLKKDTAQFTSPQTPEGKEYWDKLYKKAEELYGSENITIPTLTRPWIVPDEIIIRETPDNAYIYKATLKVMLEQDYLKDSTTYSFKDERSKALNEYSSQLIREQIIPKLTKDVNTAKRYAPLRQVYYSLILAQWFKQKFYGKSGLYSYLIDKKNLSGLTSNGAWRKTTYFNAYKQSFQDGEYNIKEPIYTPTGQVIRSYMSGGMGLQQIIQSATLVSGDAQKDAVSIFGLKIIKNNVSALIRGSASLNDPATTTIEIEIPEETPAASPMANKKMESSSETSADISQTIAEETIRKDSFLIRIWKSLLKFVIYVPLNRFTPEQQNIIRSKVSFLIDLFFQDSPAEKKERLIEQETSCFYPSSILYSLFNKQKETQEMRNGADKLLKKLPHTPAPMKEELRSFFEENLKVYEREQYRKNLKYVLSRLIWISALSFVAIPYIVTLLSGEPNYLINSGLFVYLLYQQLFSSVTPDAMGTTNKLSNKVFIPPMLAPKDFEETVLHEAVHLLKVHGHLKIDMPMVSAFTVLSEYRNNKVKDYWFRLGQRLFNEFSDPQKRWQEILSELKKTFPDDIKYEDINEFFNSLPRVEEKPWTKALGGIIAGIAEGISEKSGDPDFAWRFLVSNTHPVKEDEDASFKIVFNFNPVDAENIFLNQKEFLSQFSLPEEQTDRSSSSAIEQTDPLHVIITLKDGGVLNFILSADIVAALEYANINPDGLINEALQEASKNTMLSPVASRARLINDQTIRLFYTNCIDIAKFLPIRIFKQLMFVTIWSAILRKKSMLESYLGGNRVSDVDFTRYLNGELTSDEILNIWMAEIISQKLISAFSDLLDQLVRDSNYRFTPEQVYKFKEFYERNQERMDVSSKRFAIRVFLFLILRSGLRHELREQIEALSLERDKLERIDEQMKPIAHRTLDFDSPLETRITAYEELLSLDPNSLFDRKQLEYLRSLLARQKNESKERESARLEAEQLRDKPTNQLFTIIVEKLSKKNYYSTIALLRILSQRKGLTLLEANLALALTAEAVEDYKEANELYKYFIPLYRNLFIQEMVSDLDLLSPEIKDALVNIYLLMFNDSSIDRRARITATPELHALSLEVIDSLENRLQLLKFRLNQLIVSLNTQLMEGMTSEYQPDITHLLQLPAEVSKPIGLKTILARSEAISGKEQLKLVKNYFRTVYGIELVIPFSEDTSFVDIPESSGFGTKALLYSKQEIKELLSQLIILDQLLSELPPESVLLSLTLQKMLIVKEIRASWRHSEAVKENLITLALGMPDWRRTFYHEFGHSLHGPRNNFATYVDSRRLQEIILKHRDFFEKVDPSIIEMVVSQEVENTDPGLLLWRVFQTIYKVRLDEWKEFNKRIGIDDLNEPFKNRYSEIASEYDIRLETDVAKGASTNLSLSVEYMFEKPYMDAGGGNQLVRDDFNELVAEYTQLYIQHPESLRNFDEVAYDFITAILGATHSKRVSVSSPMQGRNNLVIYNSQEQPSVITKTNIRLQIPRYRMPQLPANNEAIEPLPSSSISFSGSSPMTAELLIRIEEHLRSSAERIAQLIDQEIMAMPEDNHQYSLSKEVWDEYMRLFQGICEMAKGLPEFDELARLIEEGKFSQPAVMNTLQKVFLGANRFIVFGTHFVHYNNRFIENLPVLAIYDVEGISPVRFNLMGERFNVVTIYIKNAIVPDYLKSRLGYDGKVAFAFPMLTIDGAIPIVVNTEVAAQNLLYNYQIRLHIEKTGQLPEEQRTGYKAINELLARILVKQWPQITDNAQEFFDLHFQNYIWMAVFHELTHIATSDYLDEIYPYLVEISATQCHWLRVYKIIRDAITNRESWSVEHSQAVHFFLTEFFPNIFQQREPGSLEGIPEDMHLAAAKVLNEGYPTGLFIAISLLCEEILKKEASHEFLELRQRDKTKAGSPVVQKEEVNASGAQTNKDLGGIDMRSLPKYTKVERVGGTTSLSAAPICNFSVGPSINQYK